MNTDIVAAAHDELICNTNKLAPDLAARINEAHEAASQSAASAVEHARRAGELLLEAKTAVKHGEWQPWLSANVAFSDRTARGYMRLARELPKLSDEKRQRVAEMPLRDASKELWKMKREDRKAEIREAYKSPPTSSAPGVVELWTSPRKVLETEASRMERSLNDLQRQNIRDDFKMFVRALPGNWAKLPPGTLDAAERARAQFMEEARKRAAELIEWVDERRAEVARLLQEAAEAASDYPSIFVGTRDGSAILGDIRFLSMPCWEIPPDDESDDEGTTDFVAEYLESHPGATLDEALQEATAFLEGIATKAREAAA